LTEKRVSNPSLERAVSFGRNGEESRVVGVAIFALAAAYGYWVTESLVAVLGLMCVLTVAYVATRQRVRTNFR
jgi:hypothetical protein